MGRRVQTNGLAVPLSASMARRSFRVAASPRLGDLVAQLPEIYQPILGHHGLSTRVSRRCDDRLAAVVSVYRAMEGVLARPLRVLDLGCAQGFFSLSLSELGAEVHGVDVLDANIAVCKALAAERGDRRIAFETARVETILAGLELDHYDLILGLSVFHHVVHARGASAVRGMLAAAGLQVAAVLIEVALASEPAEWAVAQPRSERELVSDYAFVHEIGRHETHLSEIRRPLLFASNRHWYLDGRAGVFDRWRTVSNAAVPEVHGGTRRFYFSDKHFITQFRLDKQSNRDQNLLEWSNAVAFLGNPPPGLAAPRLEGSGRNDTEAWLIRELLPGTTLATHIAEGYKAYDPARVLRDVLGQLQALEAAGLYHQDLRTWNVILDSTGAALLIDYGGISRSRTDCTWPNDVFLSFLIFMREVLAGVQQFPSPDRTGCFNPDSLPQPYRGAVWRMLQIPFAQWRFADFARAIESPQAEAAPATIDRGNALLLLGTKELGLNDLRSTIASMEACAASSSKLIQALEIPNAPLPLRMVLPLARMIDRLRAFVSRR